MYLNNLGGTIKANYIKIFIILIIIFIVLYLMFNFIFWGKNTQKRTKASAVLMTLSFNPPDNRPSPGQNFTVSIKAKPSTDIVARGYSFKVNFDKTKIQLRRIVYNLGVVSQGLGDDDSKLTSINQNGIINIQGEIQLADGQILTAAQETDVAVLDFASNSSEASMITHESSGEAFYIINQDYSLTEVPIADTGSMSLNAPLTPTSIAPTTVTPTTASGSVTLNLKLKFQGINSKPRDDLNKMNVKIRLKGNGRNSSGYKIGEFSVLPEDSGSGIWTGSLAFDVPPGNDYIIFVKGPKHIQKKICDSTPTETRPAMYRCSKGKITLTQGVNNLNFAGIILLSGDLPDQDGVVNSYDTSLVLNNLTKTDVDTLNKADVNLDGIVNLQDRSLIINALSFKYDEEED